MEAVRISKTAQQAFEWLGKMGIEVKPAIKTGEMYDKDIIKNIRFSGRERQCSLLFAKVKRSRKLAALSGNDKTSSQWLEDGGRRGWTHPLLFVDRYIANPHSIL